MEKCGFLCVYINEFGFCDAMQSECIGDLCECWEDCKACLNDGCEKYIKD